MKTALTIAGSDSSGGAGIQADIKTMTMRGVYAMSAISALTAQNTTGVRGIFEVSADFLRQQLDAVFEDIFPDAVKIGMILGAELVEAAADRLHSFGAKNIVVDPVMIATSGASLVKTEAVEVMKRELFRIARVVTPNIFEAEVLADMTICGKADMTAAAKKIGDEFGCGVLVKGGHRTEDANDVFYENGKVTWFESARCNNPNTHGTGCTLSSAIAAELAKGCEVCEAIRNAKSFITSALEAGLNLGKGSGPLMHNFELKDRI